MELLEGREQAPLSADTFLRYQRIGLTPAIDTNGRFELHRDGRLYAAVNEAAPPLAAERFNVALPDTPTLTLDADGLAAVRAALERVEFFESPVYVAHEGVRDGAFSIVTAARETSVHEVWYVHVDNELTDLLWSLLGPSTSEGDEAYDPERILADLERIRDAPT